MTNVRTEFEVTGATATAALMGTFDQRLRRNLAAQVQSALREGATLAAQYAPVDTGALAASIRVKSFDPRTLEGTYGPDPVDAKAIAQERGTDPYVIRPVNAKALRFEVGGKTVFAKQVNHPGVPATRYMERSKEVARAELRRGVKAAIADTVAGR